MKPRTLVTLLFVATTLVACSSRLFDAEAKIDHFISVATELGSPRVAGVTVLYGGARPLRQAALSGYGGGQGMPMTVPEVASVTWTDSTGKLQTRQVPIRAKAPLFIQGKEVLFRFRDDKLTVLVGYTLSQDWERVVIYSD
jgi:hypothetical protein